MQRRSHRKSRFGCRRCKMRRMKCDEVHPACGNCTRHAVPCDFTQLRDPEAARNLEPVLIPSLRRLNLGAATSIRTERTTSEPISSSSQSTMIQASRHGSRAASPASPTFIQEQEQPVVFELPYPTAIGTPSDRLLELRLFHHYMQMSHSTRQWKQPSPQKSIQGSWKNWIAGLAMKDHTLMDAVLGFSAANLGALNPSDRLISQASHRYMLRAVTSHAKQIRQGINDQNGEVLFATSTFMALFSSMVPPSDVSGPPLHWFRPYQGTRAIAEAAGWDRIHKSKIQLNLEEDLGRFESFLKSPQNEHAYPFDFLLDGVQPDNEDPETIAAYQHAVAHLNMIDQSPQPRFILRFPAMVPRRFVALLKVEDPRTLTIVGYFFMLLRRYGGLWWVGRQAVMEFKALMKLIPDEWRPRMDWAVRVIEQEESSPESTPGPVDF